MCLPYPMNMKRTMAAVMRAPLLAGESIPNIANTGTYKTTQVVHTVLSEKQFTASTV